MPAGAAVLLFTLNSDLPFTKVGGSALVGVAFVLFKIAGCLMLIFGIWQAFARDSKY